MKHATECSSSKILRGTISNLDNFYQQQGMFISAIVQLEIRENIGMQGETTYSEIN